MQHILADVYRLIFKASKNHKLSKIFAVIYALVLTSILAYGSLLLLQEVIPSAITNILTSPPYNKIVYIFFIFIVFLVYWQLIPTNRQIMVIGPRVKKPFLLYLFSTLAVLCILYIVYVSMQANDPISQ